MLYLVNYHVQKSFYQKGKEKQEVNHIVEAESEQMAMDKIEEYYSQKDVEFYVTHHVDFNYCNEIIK